MSSAPDPANPAEPILLEVPAEFDRVRADKVLHALCPEHSRAALQRWLAAGLVWRGEEALIKSDRLRAGDSVSFTIPPPRPAELRAVDLPLSILHEDEHLLAVDKAAGMVVHPGAGTAEDTLVHALLHHCRGQLSGIGGVERPGIVHRLDKETSGVLVVAKTDAAYLGLARQFQERTLEKTYLALVTGIPRTAAGRCDAPIGRHPVQRLKMAVRTEGRPALTEWRRSESWAAGYSLLEVRILTGRTHQIRVHLAHLGHPVAGDSLYGFRPRDAFGEALPRVMLHAWRLVLTHPVDGTALALEAPLPGDFSAALQQLRGQPVT